METYFFIEVVLESGGVRTFGPYLSLEAAATLLMDHLYILVPEGPITAYIHEKYINDGWKILRTPFTEKRS